MLELEDIADVVASAIKEAQAPLLARIAELEAREIPAAIVGEKGDPGEVDMEAVNRRIDEAVAKEVARLPVPKDGVGLADAFKDVDRNLILVMTDGRTKNMGRIDGENGRHGFNADDYDVEMLDDSKTMRFTARGAGYEHSFDLFFPVLIDRGVYSPGKEYQPGDTVTWGGSLWIAQRSTIDKPDMADSGWRLAVKKGRDGKDATK